MSAAALPFAATAAGGGGAGETAADGGCAAPSTVAVPRALPVLGARRVATSALIAPTGSGFRVRAAATTAWSDMSGSTAAIVPPGGSPRSTPSASVSGLQHTKYSHAEVKPAYPTARY